jgi:acyl-CoA thioester hydrolase
MLHLYNAYVEPGWCDYNGHMNDAYYAVAFSRATDALADRIGLDAAGRKASGRTIYTLALVIRYLREVRAGEGFAVFVQLLEHDAKRIRFWLEMRHGAEGHVLATSEQLIACVDQSGEKPRIANFLPEMRAALDAIVAGQAGLAAPEQVGKGISLKR